VPGFLDTDPFGRRLGTGWHVRLHYLRRYGAIAALGDLPERAGDWDLDEPIVAATIARMKLRELPALPPLGQAWRGGRGSSGSTTRRARSPLGDHSLPILALLSVFGADVMARVRRARGTHVAGDGYARFP
jgi:hypothetical protein